MMAQSLLSWLAQNSQKEKDLKQIGDKEPENAISFQSFVSSDANEGKRKEIEKRIDGGEVGEASKPIEHTPGCTQAQPITIAYGFPACPNCECSYITEHPSPNGDGGVYLRCWSCRSNIDKKVLDNRIRINANTSTEQRRLLPWL